MMTVVSQGIYKLLVKTAEGYLILMENKDSKIKNVKEKICVCSEQADSCSLYWLYFRTWHTDNLWGKLRAKAQTTLWPHVRRETRDLGHTRGQSALLWPEMGALVYKNPQIFVPSHQSLQNKQYCCLLDDSHQRLYLNYSKMSHQFLTIESNTCWLLTWTYLKLPW